MITSFEIRDGERKSGDLVPKPMDSSTHSGTPLLAAAPLNRTAEY